MSATQPQSGTNAPYGQAVWDTSSGNTNEPNTIYGEVHADSQKQSAGELDDSTGTGQAALPNSNPSNTQHSDSTATLWQGDAGEVSPLLKAQMQADQSNPDSEQLSPLVKAQMSQDASSSTPNTQIGPVTWTPLQHATHVVQGALGGVFKSVLPVNSIPNPFDPQSGPNEYQLDPWGRTAENITKIPGTVTTNILGGPLFTTAYSGMQAEQKNEAAYDQALRSQQYNAAQNLQNASTWTPLLGLGYGAALSKIPAYMGGNTAARIASGAGLGYGTDIGHRALEQYATTSQIFPSKLNYNPGYGTFIGGGLGFASPYFTPSTARPDESDIDLHRTNSGWNRSPVFEGLGKPEKVLKVIEGVRDSLQDNEGQDDHSKKRRISY